MYATQPEIAVSTDRILHRRNRRMARREGLSYRQHKDSPEAKPIWFAIRTNKDGSQVKYPLGLKPGI